MKQLTCEMCGSTDLMKQDGVFVCQSCGTKYSVEEARKMMIEGPVDVSGSTVKVDTSGELVNLYQIARRAKDDNNGENAAKYYDMILVKDPTSWEAYFYVVYFRAMECKIAQIQSAGESVAKCIGTVLKLIKDNVANQDEQKLAYTEVAIRVMKIANMLYYGAKNHYDQIDSQIKSNFTAQWIGNASSAIDCVWSLGDNLDLLFGADTEANALSVEAWKKGVMWHQSLNITVFSKDGEQDLAGDYTSKINKYDSSYTAPPRSTTGGCYIATAVYGSYDCPQVWTLRRFRDYSLAESWYGRAFIRTYYAISPTLVEWFGDTNWFKKMWKGTLDRMVANLNADGVENTPYEDIDW